VTINYVVGIYSAAGEPWQFGYETVDVTIEAGQIVLVELKQFDTEDVEINYDEWGGGHQVHIQI
jgi:hypothetical protein